jgi:Tfp pilus assembly protein PilX
MRERNMTFLKKKPKEKGSILIIVLLVGVVLLLLTTPFLLKLGTTQRMTVKSFKEVQALSLAESGVESTIWELNHGDITSWPGDSNTRTLTLSNFQHAAGKIVGDINLTVQDPTSMNPVVTSMGRVKFINNADVERTNGKSHPGERDQFHLGFWDLWG